MNRWYPKQKILIAQIPDQYELFDFGVHLSDDEISDLMGLISGGYNALRWARPRKSFRAVAASRKIYRKIAVHKKRLLNAGVSNCELLTFLACCRLKCEGRKPPFKGCKFCS